MQFPFVQYLDGLPAWERFLVLVAVSVVAAKVVEAVSIEIVHRAVRGTESEFDDVLFEELHLPFYVSVALGGIYLAALSVKLPATLTFYLEGGSLSVVLLVWARALVRIGDQFLEAAKAHGDKYSFAPIFKNLWTFAILLGAVFGLLSVWNVDVTPLLASAGIVGIAVGFAAKDTVANFFGGLALYFDHTYKLGDYIQLDSGESGTVVEIGIRSTTLMTRDEVTVTVPNSVLNATRITNQSAPERRKRIRVPIGVAYGTDLDRFEAALLDVAVAEDLVMDTPSPRARFRSFGDSALQYELLCWVATPTREAKATHRLNRGLYRRLDADGIDIPFPQRDVTVREVPDDRQVDPVAGESETAD